ncbi:hypothetical protein [Synechocystis sp. PCC 7509]|uniref:hypothetical protein n=1 Tax=Synechocystis sp. PCC 7509 TaxID=927677 RepID=UPI0002ABA919|nr:hypothetical protein [Synechocystis sp. PCC 7509]
MVKRKPTKRKPDTEADELPEPWFTTPPQSGLVPFGNSPFYHTPDDSADPTDCNRYPSSIYCGENPFTEIPIGIGPAIVIDECNIGIELTPILGFVTLPPQQIVYRKDTPECRNREPPVELPPPPSPPPGMEFLKIPLRPECVCHYTFGYHTIHKKNGEIEIFSGQAPSITVEDYPDFQIGRTGGVLHLPSGQIIYVNTTRIFTELERPTGQSSSTFEDTYSWENLSNGDLNFLFPEDMPFVIVENSCSPCPVPEAPYISFPPPPPPPPPRCDCTMTCCPDVTQNEDLIKSLIKKVDKLSKVVGVDDYPVNLPTSLISKDEGFLGNLIPNFNEDVPSLTRFLSWYVQRFDEIMGQWEIPIQIKDSDPSQPGDQPVGVKLPNMAEAIAEMFTLCFQTNINTETLLNMGMRTLGETGANKTQGFTTYKLLQSLTEWAGYKQKDLALKMPLLFTLEKIRYDEILKESEVEVGCVEFDEKFGLEADLMKFREGVAILQAIYKVKLNPSSDIKAQILSHLLDTFKGVNKINGEDDDTDFEKFIEEVETGFINIPGAKETVNPYGSPYNQRPKIRDLSKNKPPTTPP